MNPTLVSLFELQELEVSASERRAQRKVRQLRASLSPDVLRRWDHLTDQGRRPLVRLSDSNGCGGCHLTLPKAAAIMVRLHPEQTHVCPNCGCFLFADPLPAAMVAQTQRTSLVRAAQIG